MISENINAHHEEDIHNVHNEAAAEKDEAMNTFNAMVQDLQCKGAGEDGTSERVIQSQDHRSVQGGRVGKGLKVSVKGSY